ncbi:MAG: FAD-dependent oxidoreductase [Firmicutes bacterium]|nr:FAD-dependent oxidoreductase [Bacillota bacterium]
MAQIKLTINNQEVTAEAGCTIMQAAASAGISIPSLCHDESVPIYASCGVCVVEAENSPRLLRACSTLAADGMVIHTESPRAVACRKFALELLLSDHTGDCRPPCALECPAHTDCQGYAKLIAKGEYGAAVELIRQKLPLPASIGRVCPHPCEKACRRALVEEPVSLAALKVFVSDQWSVISGQLKENENLITDKQSTPQKLTTDHWPLATSVAIIGGGPGGLTAAYFLKRKGHNVTVFDAMPKMGGMLRYGIPEYRLPKAVLDAEVKAIADLGVTIKNNVRIGKDVMLDELRSQFDAVVIAAGAWTAMPLNCPGENLTGVVGGIDFLREVALNQITNYKLQITNSDGKKNVSVGVDALIDPNQSQTGANGSMRASTPTGNTASNPSAPPNPEPRTPNPEPSEIRHLSFVTRHSKIAVVGGGNVAMDACRTAVRLGAKKVYVIYRRTRDEMPAEDIEIEEAVEEGVIFKYLSAPIEIIAGEDGKKVAQIRLQKMQLGEPDASGRRSPVPVAGEEELLEVDTVIAAIGSVFNPEGFDGVALTKRKTISADEHTFRTNLDGVFAIGDATNKGADIAIAAIGEAGRAAEVIDAYLVRGEEVAYREPVLVKDVKTKDDFKDKPILKRARVKCLPAELRRTNFTEINSIFSEEEAKAEASRCLECGCGDYFECKLIKYADRYGASVKKYEGEKNKAPVIDEHPKISRNPNKCVLCGLCVRVCDDEGVGAFGFAGRGFGASVAPAMNLPLSESGCTSCGRCVTLCPTGALQDK